MIGLKKFMYRLESCGSRRSFFYKKLFDETNKAVQKYHYNTKNNDRKYNSIQLNDLRLHTTTN